MDDKGFVFTTDILLALVIVTLAIGMASDQVANLNYQLQDFTGRQTLEKNVNDAADYLIKNPGNPNNWETLGTKPPNTIPGLATLTSGFVENQLISSDKMYALEDNPSLLVNLVNPGGNNSLTNYHLVINLINPDGSSGQKMIDIIHEATSFSSAKEVAIANRTVMVVAGKTIFSLFDISHLDPGHPVIGEGYLWYWSGTGKPNAQYVGPGNTTGSTLPPSFTPDTDNYDYFIYITEGGSGIPVEYAFTGGDEVVNGNYSGFNDINRLNNLNNVVNAHTAPYKWVDIKNPPTYSTYNITGYLNYITSTGKPYMKLWIHRGGSINKPLSLDVIAVPKGQSGLIKSPGKLVLTIWE